MKISEALSTRADDICTCKPYFSKAYYYGCQNVYKFWELPYIDVGWAWDGPDGLFHPIIHNWPMFKYCLRDTACSLPLWTVIFQLHCYFCQPCFWDILATASKGRENFYSVNSVRHIRSSSLKLSTLQRGTVCLEKWETYYVSTQVQLNIKLLVLLLPSLYNYVRLCP